MVQAEIFWEEPIGSALVYVHWRNVLSMFHDANQGQTAIWHLVFGMLFVGYAQEYYFHLSMFFEDFFESVDTNVKKQDIIKRTLTRFAIDGV